MSNESDIWIELNNCSQKKENSRYQEGYSSLISIIEGCKKQGAKVSIGSDAHYPSDIGKLSLVMKLLKEINFPEHLIVNRYTELFKEKMVNKRINYYEED